MPADVSNAFDVALFFSDAALSENKYLQPQKLQSLLFLAQAYYSVAFQDRKLMPAVFVADELGPLEPNVYVALSRGKLEATQGLSLPREVERFLEAIWRRFGHMSSEKVIHLTSSTEAYKRAYKRGKQAEIDPAEMRSSFIRTEKMPHIDQVIKPKIYRTQSGKPVVVKSWVPGNKSTD
ncbi:MAG: hypothetical protein CBB68_11535 [Rhodospirillaceae bacterium TMED8]|nr:hypothetical protein [Magnetovibrio sp.]OUT49627.1 MAG: hypothetical protein CBB68_11535 [Rhodospirillaceae bacterium TMED8]|tara:strand:+ start:3030 stop:3566 length:537 start_codon:yes stop_codon:yes gene_type:complete